jgi:biotin carboxyl carrier protein
MTPARKSTAVTAAVSRTQAAGESPATAKKATKASSTHMDANGDYGDKKARCRTLIIDGDKYRTRYNSKFEKRKTWSNPNPKKITSSIPGTVVKVYTKVGEQVKKGDPILLLEAMKMKNKILFPIDGKVKSIKVKEGERVPKDYLMLEMA